MSGAKVYQVLGGGHEAHISPRPQADHNHKDAHIAPDCKSHADAAVISTEGPIDVSDSEEGQIEVPPKSKGCCELL